MPEVSIQTYSIYASVSKNEGVPPRHPIYQSPTCQEMMSPKTGLPDWKPAHLDLGNPT